MCVESMLRVRWECVGVGALYHVVDAYQVAFAHGTTDVQGFFFLFDSKKNLRPSVTTDVQGRP